MCCNKNDYRRRQINNFLITFITQTFAYFPEREYKKKSVNCFYRILIHKFCSSEAANRGVLQIICSAAAARKLNHFSEQTKFCQEAL